MNTQLKRQRRPAVSLRDVAEYTGLTPGTLSSVLNNAPSSRSVPQHTKDRIFAAVRHLNYKPNYIARALRNKRTYTLAVLADDIGEHSVALVMSGVERCLKQRNYFLMVGSHRNDAAEFARCSSVFVQRGVEGLITLGPVFGQTPELPVVSVEVGPLPSMIGDGWREQLQRKGQNAAVLLLERIETEGEALAS